MKKTTIDLGSLSTLGVAGLVTAGLVMLPVTSATGAQDTAVKRDENSAEVVLVTDDDDDTAGTDTNTMATDTDSATNTAMTTAGGATASANTDTGMTDTAGTDTGTATNTAITGTDDVTDTLNTETNTGTNTGNTNTGTGTHSGDQNDPTNSQLTTMSHDRDKSRGDKTRDWTSDGAGAQKIDWSANKTNDRSRNDTRARRR